MPSLRSIVVLLAAIVAAVLPACAAVTSDVLPPAGAAGGWRMRGSVRTYSPANLYEYIDGNADLFLSYDFADLSVGDYEPAEGKGWISVDVHNMANPLQAFGIFGAERPPDVALTSLGTQGYETDGLVAFWKGQYYVKVSLIEGENAAAAQALARAAAGRIDASTEMPSQLNRLPAKGRLKGTERYLMRGVLGHAFLFNTVCAQYQLGAAGAVLYVADLFDSDTVSLSYDRLREYYGRTGTHFVDLPNLGEQAFAAHDEFHGEVVVVAVDRFVIVASSEKASRQEVMDLASDSIATAKAAAAADPSPAASAAVGQSCPLSGPCPAARRPSP